MNAAEMEMVIRQMAEGNIQNMRESQAKTQAIVIMADIVRALVAGIPVDPVLLENLEVVCPVQKDDNDEAALDGREDPE